MALAGVRSRSWLPLPFKLMVSYLLVAALTALPVFYRLRDSRTVADATLALRLGVGVGVSAALALSLVAALLVSRPLRRLRDVARAFAAASWVEVKRPRSRDELGELADALDELGRQLRHQETELVGSQLARSGLGSLCGTLREQVHFLDRAPDDVLAIRQRGRSIAGARIGGEVVLAYRRTLEILAPRDGPLRATDELALRQIVRLNLRHFTTRLDDRDQIVRHYDPAIGGFAIHEIAKVYHLDVVVRLGGPDPGVQLERWRVVFSREGIERIEPAA